MNVKLKLGPKLNYIYVYIRLVFFPFFYALLLEDGGCVLNTTAKMQLNINYYGQQIFKMASS